MDSFPDLGLKTALPSKLILPIVNPVDLTHLPVPRREWIVPEWLPVGCCTLLYGDGGTGKTLLAHQLLTSTALNTGWCGLSVKPCRSFALFCEDDEDELHRRQVAICAAMGVSLADLEPMRWVSGVGNDNVLMRFDIDGNAQTTPLYEAIRQAALDHGAELLVLDTAADLFDGNENDRRHVRRFIGQLNKLAIEIHGAVLLNAHPSRSGLASGNIDGGSTAWNNTARSRWSLGRPQAEDGEAQDPDARVLAKRKANYSRIGDEIELRWSDGALEPPHQRRSASHAGEIPDQRVAEELFLILLDRCTVTNVKVSHNTKAGNYAPKVFGLRTDRQGFNKKQFATAMQVLIDQGRVVVENYGRPGDYRQCLVRGSDEGDI